MPTQNILRALLVTAFILLVPLAAMQFTNEMDWDGRDFLLMGVLLSGTGLLYEFIAAKMKTTQHRVVAGAIVAGVLLLMWAELAVGLFNSPFAGN